MEQIADRNLRVVVTALVIAFALAFSLAPAAQAQTFKVIYDFTGGAGGVYPWASLTIDKAGNLYGATELGGTGGFGLVFKLAPKNSGWLFTPLYSFQGGSDGRSPEAPVAIGTDGSLYGTTVFGGTDNCGIVFNLRPGPTRPVSVFAPWSETVLHNLGQSGSDGCILMPGSHLTRPATSTARPRLGVGGQWYRF